MKYPIFQIGDMVSPDELSNEHHLFDIITPFMGKVYRVNRTLFVNPNSQLIQIDNDSIQNRWWHCSYFHLHSKKKVSLKISELL